MEVQLDFPILWMAHAISPCRLGPLDMYTWRTEGGISGIEGGMSGTEGGMSGIEGGISGTGINEQKVVLWDYLHT